MSRGNPTIYDIIKRPEHYLSGCPLREFYRGIVEDVNDPEKRGRVRVRIESIFRSQPGAIDGDDQGDSVKTKELPWAHVLIQGQGTNYGCFNTPLVGDAVVLVFEFGHKTQPLVIGGWWGMAGSPKKTEVPIAAQGGDQIGETGFGLKGQDVGVVGVTGVTLNEPANPYEATYPNNQVLRSSSGHLIELDNTAGKERVNITHKSGTWVEFHPDGNLVFGVQGKRYTLVVGEDEQHYKKNQHIVIDKDSTKKVLGDTTDETEGDSNSQVTGDRTVASVGETAVTSVGNMKLQSIGGSATIKAATKITTQAPSYAIEGAAAGTAAATHNIQAAAANISASGATGQGVVTTGTHPIDYITGIPILGLINFTAGP